MDRPTPPCPQPLSWETLVSYWAGDLAPDDEDQAELHLMGCAACTEESQRVATMTAALRARTTAAPALRVIPGEGRAAPRPRRAWVWGGAGVTALAAAAAVLLLVLPRGAGVFRVQLAAPVRDVATVEVTLPRGAREVRLEPEVGAGATVNGARVRRLDGGWLTGRVDAGPPFAVVVPDAELVPGRYEVQLVWTSPEGREEPRGFYRFTITPPSN